MHASVFVDMVSTHLFLYIVIQVLNTCNWVLVPDQAAPGGDCAHAFEVACSLAGWHGRKNQLLFSIASYAIYFS